jgi:glycosyltransferase involved in cell wall biosynthesis
VLTAASLTWNPRAFREAEAAARAGYEVLVLGAVYSTEQLETDAALARAHGFEFESVVPAGGSRDLSMLRRRGRTRLAMAAGRRLGVETHWQLGPAVVDLARRAAQIEADCYLLHLEQAAWVGLKLLRRGRRVSLDMEDWYSEDLLLESRQSRPVRLLREAERRLLTHGDLATTPSLAMSQALVREFGCPAPRVIYNAARWSERNTIDGRRLDRTGDRPSIHWFSQTLGPGRGLEELLAALPHLGTEAEIHLRGRPSAGFDGWIAEATPEAWRNRIFVHPLVTERELLSRIAEHDIGFAGEMTYSRSRDLTITNKILHYLTGGLAVVGSDTAGQREVAAQAGEAVRLYQPGDVAGLARQLNDLLGSPEALARAKAAALEAAEGAFSWDRQEPRLLERLERLTSGAPGGGKPARAA